MLVRAEIRAPVTLQGRAKTRRTLQLTASRHGTRTPDLHRDPLGWPNGGCRSIAGQHHEFCPGVRRAIRGIRSRKARSSPAGPNRRLALQLGRPNQCTGVQRPPRGPRPLSTKQVGPACPEVSAIQSAPDCRVRPTPRDSRIDPHPHSRPCPRAQIRQPTLPSARPLPATSVRRTDTPRQPAHQPPIRDTAKPAPSTLVATQSTTWPCSRAPARPREAAPPSGSQSIASRRPLQGQVDAMDPGLR